MRLENSLLGKCGIYCGACRLHALKKCDSCSKIYPTVGEAECPFYKCVITKGLRTCGECESFPCDHHYGRMAVYAKVYLNWKKKESQKSNRKE